MKKVFLLILLALSTPSIGQKKIRSLEVSDTIINVFIDRPGDLYIATKNGQIQKFDENGKLLLLYHHKEIPTLFDPRDGSRLFAYYRNNQLYQILNPSFEVTSSYHIDSAFAIHPWLISPSGDTKLWILDAADHSLKKINPKISEVELEVIVDSTLINDATAFSYMREYQGFVFLLNPTRGIFIFNSLGKHIKTIAVSGIDTFNFLGEELYYVQNQKIKLFDLFSADAREIDLGYSVTNVILTDKRMFTIHSKTIDITEFTP
jgi:hypothetical protein